jgi:glycosyltransferase involved in cell wall biosynthesis
MQEEVKVSVIIPTYNSARSTDNTREVLREYERRVRYFHKENGGVSSARNYGIEQARGKYLAFLDADDVWLPEKLQKQISALEQNPNCRACYTAFIVGDEDLKPLNVTYSKRHSNTLEDLLFHGNVVATPSTVLAEKDLFQAVGGFDRQLSQCADWEMWVRIAAKTEFVYLDEPSIIYRQHDLNMSKNASLMESDSLLVMEKGFAIPDLSESLQARKNKALARTYMVLAGIYFQAKMYGDFARCAYRSVGLDFKQLSYLLAFPLRRVSRN